MSGKKGSEKTDTDAGLWDRVKRTVDPLDAKQRARYSQALAEYLDGDGTEKATSQTKPTPHRVHPSSGALKHHVQGHPAATKHGPPAVKTKEKPGQSAQLPLVGLDRKARSRIARGRTPIYARLDLHGLRQHEAHDVLRSFIWRAHAAGHRTVLVITGKGSRVRDPHPDAPPWAMGSGILRRAVPGWLAAPDMRAAILSVEDAHASHGGEGALYVRLRAKRADS